MKMQEFKKHIMTGISFLIPMVVMAGIVGAVQKAFSWSGVALSDPLIAGLEFSGYSITKISDFMAVLGKMNSFGFNWAYAFLCAGIAFSIADRPGIVPGFAIGYFAGGPTKTGFIGAMLMGFLIGYFVKWMKTWKVPKALAGLMPVLVIPVLATMVGSFVFFGVLMRPIAAVMMAFQAWIQGLAEGSLFVVGAVIGACMGFDMGGPVNKTASMAANALYADMPDGIGGCAETAKIIGGMTPAIGMGLAAIIAPKKFTRQQKDAAYTCIPMGLCFITEGVLLLLLVTPIAVALDILLAYFELNSRHNGTTLEWPRLVLCAATTFGIIALMIVVGIWYPARKAMHVQPAEALHAE